MPDTAAAREINGQDAMARAYCLAMLTGDLPHADHIFTVAIHAGHRFDTLSKCIGQQFKELNADTKVPEPAGAGSSRY